MRTAKDGNWFCFPENIPGEFDRIFRWLKAEGFLRGLPPERFASRGAYFLSELNALHLFREGNGRTQNAFFALVAAEVGHPIDFDKLDPTTFLDAMVHSFDGDTIRLEAQILQIIT